jgi:hypothetical protein
MGGHSIHVLQCLEPVVRVGNGDGGAKKRQDVGIVVFFGELLFLRRSSL